MNFNGGTGGTLKSATVEQAIVELAERGQVLDEALTTPTGNFGITYNGDGNTATVGIAVPFTVSVVGGKPTITGTDFLNGAVFAPGTGGDLESVNYSGAVLELASIIQAAELAATPVLNNLTFTLDTDTSVATVAITLPVAYSLDANGKTVITATPYLA
jgi:hypothetical protein